MSYQPAASQPSRWHNPQYDDRSLQEQDLYLYLIWIFIAAFPSIVIVRMIFECARRFAPSLPPSPPVSEPTSEAAHEPAPIPRGLDAAVINGLPIELYVNSARASADESECCICLGAFADGDKVKVLPICRHRFHCVCVDRWLRTQSSCPICRGSIGIELPV